MSQDHEQQQERKRLKNQTKALYQATRRANPVSRSLEQSSDTARKRVAREEPGVREQMLMFLTGPAGSGKSIFLQR